MAAGVLLIGASAGVTDEPETDANIVTGIDISDSVNAEEIRLEIEGVAQALRSPEVLAAIESGRHRRIGVAVFAWHHFQYAIVDWTIIASERDALAAADMLEHRVPVNVDPTRPKPAPKRGRFTDISGAVDHAWNMLSGCPFRSGRSIINIIGNGEDNIGQDAMFARDRVVEGGATVNGVVVGDAPSVLDYYGRHVIGGPGSFVLSTSQTVGIVDATMRKFRQEVAFAASSAPR